MLKHAILCIVVLAIANAKTIQKIVQNVYKNNDKGFEVLLNKADVNIHVSKDKANDDNGNVIKSVNKEIEKIQQQVAAFYERLDHTFYAFEVRPTNPNMIKCGQVRELHHIKIGDLTTDTINCMNQKRRDAVKYLNDINTISSETRKKLSEIRAKGRECIHQIDGFKNATKAWYCLEKVRRTGGSIYSTKMSELSEVTESLSSLDKRISFSLPYCSVSTGLRGIINTTVVGDNIRKCYGLERGIPNDLIPMMHVS